MVNYQCYRCGYTIPNKSKIINHFKRKYSCKSILSNIDLDGCKIYILEGITFEEYKKILETQENPKNQVVISQNQVVISQNQVISNKIYECNYCNKKYLHNQSLYKHQKTCKDKKKEEEVKDSMTELVGLLNKQIIDFKNELTKKDKQIDELIKKAGININTNTMNIVANINLLGYKETDRSHLTDNDILKCSKAGLVQTSPW